MVVNSIAWVVKRLALRTCAYPRIPLRHLIHFRDQLGARIPQICQSMPTLKLDRVAY